MASSEDIKIMQELIIKDFDLAPVSSPTKDQIFYSLKNLINHLLDHDMEKLLQGLYRIDINENKLKAILHDEAPEHIAESLTRLILERVHQKALTRMKYKK